MRVAQILIAAVTLGLAAGYAWSALLPHKAHVHVPRPATVEPIVIPETAADKQWADRAQDKAAAFDDNGLGNADAPPSKN